MRRKSFYDARGNKIREDDELGRSTLRVYDSLNRVVKEARDMDGDHELSAADLVTETTYTKLNGKQTVKSPNGWVTTMAYDGLKSSGENDGPVREGNDL